jgi:predicted tellurium resistance membrane protein TerC
MGETELFSVLLSLATLTALEIVLGVDNVIFISILTSRLPHADREKARKLGISLALVMRLGLLSLLSWITRLTTRFGWGVDFTGKALILSAAECSCSTSPRWKSTTNSRGPEDSEAAASARAQFASVLVQIIALDLVFSLDSVITGKSAWRRSFWVMVLANVLAMAVMWFGGKTIGDFVHRHPTFKMLALSFLLMIGVMLVGEGFGVSCLPRATCTSPWPSARWSKPSISGPKEGPGGRAASEPDAVRQSLEPFCGLL